MDNTEKLYIYKLTLNNDDNTQTVSYCSSVKDICDKLKLTRSVVNNIIRKRVKKYDFMSMKKYLRSILSWYTCIPVQTTYILSIYKKCL